MGLTDITTAIADLGDPELWCCGDRELADLLPAVNTAIHTLESIRIRLLHEIGERSVHAGTSTGNSDNPYADTASWMAGTSIVSGETARRITRLADALDRHPQVAAAFHAGTINSDDARLITRVLDRPPVTMPDAARDAVRDYLLQAADGGNTRRLRQAIGKLRTVFPDDDGIPPGEDPARNEFWASEVAGRVMVKGDLDAETGSMLLAALSPLTTPRGDGPDGRDDRSPAQRRADAFAEILRRYLESGVSPVDGGDRPHLHLHVNARDLREQPTSNCPDHGTQTSFDDLSDDDPYHDHDQDRTAEVSADTGDCTCTAPGPEPETSVDYGEVLRQAHAGWLSWTGPLSLAAARRIGCDCTLTPIVLDDNDAPLNLGRTSRVVSRRLRRAVLARDHGCAFPQCGRPAEWCQIHHIKHWIDGGATDLDNLVMLCGHHHRLLHHSGWEVVMGTDRHPWFIPPVQKDPARTPIPSNGRASPQAA